MACLCKEKKKRNIINVRFERQNYCSHTALIELKATLTCNERK